VTTSITDKDSDGNVVRAGDRVSFTYGIPPVRVEGVLQILDGKLYLPTPGHKPGGGTLTMIRHYVGDFYKVPKGRPKP